MVPRKRWMGLDISNKKKKGLTNVFRCSTLILNNHISTPLLEAYLSDLTHADRSPTWFDTCSSALARTSTLDVCEPYPDIYNYYYCRALSRRRYVSSQAPTFFATCKSMA